jgi:hypothetical protein
MKNNPGMMQDNTVNSMINGMNPKIVKSTIEEVSLKEQAWPLPGFM